MRWRSLNWLWLGVLVLAALLALSAHRGRDGSRGSPAPPLAGKGDSSLYRHSSVGSSATAPVTDNRFPHRLSNTSKTIRELAKSDRAILLENALLDTGQPLALPIPARFRSPGEPGSYIVQSRSAPDAAFQSLLRQAGAGVIAYIPNNAYLVRASARAAKELAARPEVGAVAPYEPYYKLKPSLLALVLETPANPGSTQGTATGVQTPQVRDFPADPVWVNVLLFADGRDDTLAALRGLNVEAGAEAATPFGPRFTVRVPREQVPALAGMPGVEEMELAHVRVSANDLSRVAVGVASDSVTSSNYLGLTGADVLVNINDTGVDAAHPDLSGRVFSDVPAGLVDANGHGTHVAGIIAGSGAQSATVAYAPGSSSPLAQFQLRGKAPGATLYSLVASLDAGAAGGDAYLQQAAARTNALISNNSWLYANDAEYDLAAAGYDAAVRDALPGASGPQPLLFVFAAGNAGAGNNHGGGGRPDTIQSPGTAKNVITVGAIEEFRSITNETWTCTTNGGTTTCQTNGPWLLMTDSTNEVAAFSSRGNVGAGTEGEFGRFKPDVVAPGTFVISTRSGTWADSNYYGDTNNAVSPSPDANYFEVLSNLNESLRPFYRFESGSSLAAAEVSGTLALMEEFFRERLGATNSPALMKALLINGARSLGGAYDLQAAASTNFQGWGLIHLPNSAPAALTNLGSAARPLVFFDQSPAGALATGQSATRYLALSPAATNQPLRITLAWTDPPGSPLASLKLVNDLDLLVTNLDTGTVFFGNDIPAGFQFNRSWDSNAAPNLDFVNNVENVFLAPPLAANYSVTVVAHRVNVNAVTVNTNGIVQDYALVCASGDGQVADALSVTDIPPVLAAAPLVTTVTNQFAGSLGDWGAVLLRQRVGANAPLSATNTMPLPGSPTAVLTIGTPEQWHFYVLTNDTVFTNAVFLTFAPSTLSLPGAALATAIGVSNVAPVEADIDLYVSRDPALTNLEPSALAGADMSLGRGGTETIIYSNATPGVYYLGVKSESQEAAEFGLVAEFSELPFEQDDGFGNPVLRGFPAPAALPGGTSVAPGVADLFCVNPIPVTVRRVVVTNTITHPNLAELTGSLMHDRAAVVLDRHSPAGPAFQQSFIYDDSGEGDIPGSQPSDGPGSLQAFGGAAGLGQWRLSMAGTNQPGTNDALTVFLEGQPNLAAGVTATLLPGACRRDFLYVPPEASNVTISVSLVSGQGPLSIQFYPVASPATDSLTLVIAGAGTNATLTADNASHPPLNAGLYALRLCNLDVASVSVQTVANVILDPNPLVAAAFVSSGPVPILDDAVNSSTILVTNADVVSSVAVGVRVNHPRVSDLVLRLVSPSGTRVLLEENRGGATSAGLGSDLLVTNVAVVSTNGGGPEAVTSFFDTGQTSGTLMISYNFYSLPDTMHVYYEGQLIWDSGLVSNAGVTNLHYGPGNSSLITVIMNEGGSSSSLTAWWYQLISTHAGPSYLTFTENTNLALTPIKFAPTPFTNFNYFGTVSAPSNGLFYLPEESLDKLAGESAQGPWTLEISDTRAGAVLPAPVLVSWQLGLQLRNSVPVPLILVSGTGSTNLLGPGQTQWFGIDVPEWVSFATNTLLEASDAVQVWFNPAVPPTGTNAADVALLQGATSGSALLQTNGTPPLVPATRYYLGVRNTNAAAVGFALQVDFNVANLITLQSGTPYFNTNSGPAGAADYYLYVVTTNAVRAQFEVNGPAADITLVARKGLPLPTLANYAYLSANPGTNDELVVVYDYSSPVPLTPGNWFLAAVNSAGLPAAYSIMATEYSDYGTNILVSGVSSAGNEFCFSWNSLPGVHYYVQGKASLQDNNWTTLSGTLTAPGLLTTYCVALPSTFEFFRVHEGIVLTPPPLAISVSAGNVLLKWTGSSNSQFQVEWAPALGLPAWAAFTNLVNSTDTTYMFLDDGSQSGGFGPRRYYRVRQVK